MSKPMIENSDRGITLNKSLAWTVSVALVFTGLWVGTTVTGLTNQVQAVASNTEQRMTEAASQRAAMEARIRILENSSTRQDAQFQALAASLEEVKSLLRALSDSRRAL